MLETIRRLAQHNGLKFLAILLVWTIVLLFILKVYNNDNPYFDRNNEIQRKKKIINFLKNRKILASTGQQHLQFDYQLFFDDNKARSEEEISAAIEAEHPSIAFRYWHTHIKGAKAPSKYACAKFPSILKLKYYNKYWQTFANGNITIQLYNAYYDARAALKQPLVRLLGMSNEIDFAKQTIYCQLWYDDAFPPKIVKATVFYSIWNLKWSKSRAYNYPFLISCELPKTTIDKRIPRVVSLAAKKCDTATNSLRIHYELPSAADTAANSKSNKFAICVKGMDYPYTDISARLVEWIELQLILGASKIYFYELELHANVTKVLQHYKQRGLIDVRPITLADGEPSLANLQHYLLDAERARKRLNELIPYNDCFYRNMYRYEYIALQDIDEVLMPLDKFSSWPDLMASTIKVNTPKCPNGYASYCFRNVYFSKPNSSSPYASDIPRFMHMLQTVERNRTHMRAGFNTKCFHRTAKVVALHNHLSRAWLQSCWVRYFDASVGQLQHYRERPALKDTVYDTNIWRFKDELLQRSLDTLSEIGFIHQTVQNISTALS